MKKIVALVGFVVLASCSSGPTPDDRSSVAAVVINTLYSQIRWHVSAAAVCRSEHDDISSAVLAKIKARSIAVVQCSRVDPATAASRLQLQNSSKYAVVLSIDKVTFQSPAAATVLAHWWYGDLIATGFTFTVRKNAHGWYVAKQAESWMR